MATNPFYVQGPDYSRALSGFGEIIDETRERKRKEAAQTALQEAWSTQDPTALAQVATQYPELAGQVANMSKIQRTLGDENLRSMAMGAMELQNIPDQEGRIAYLQNRIEEVQARGGNPENTIEMLEDIQSGLSIEDQDRMLGNTIRLAERFGAIDPEMAAGGRGFARKGQFVQRINPETDQIEQGWSTYDPNTDEVSFKAIEGGALKESPEQKRKRDFEAKKKFESIKTDEDFARELNKEKTNEGKLRLAKLKIESESQNAGKEAQKMRAQDAITMLNRLEGIDLDKIYGRGESYWPEILRSQEGIDAIADREQVVNIIKVMGRGELKGQGTVSDFESKMLGDAATKLGNPNISVQAARDEIQRIKPLFESVASGDNKESRNQNARLPEGVTEEDITFTMDKYGVTREEVLRRLGQ